MEKPVTSKIICPKFYSKKCGLEISTIGLGTVKFGRNKKVKYPGGENYTLPTDAEIEMLLDTAIENGINVIDTAPSYGSAEERIGNLLGKRRDKFLIFTKVGEIFDNDTGVSNYDFSVKSIIESVHQSLKRLKIERLEGVLLHCPADDLSIINNNEILAVLNKLKQQGLIKSIGASTMSLEGGLKAAELFDILMVSYNRDYRAELPVIQKAKQQGCAVFIKKGLKSGHFKPEELPSLYQAIKQDCPDTCLVIGTMNKENLQGACYKY